MPPAGTRVRAWCFTDNKAEGKVHQEILDLFKNAVYCVFQREKEAHEHFQGYVYFNNPKSLVGVRRLLPTAHWTVAEGTPEQNRVYCTKEETRIEGPWSFGEIPRQVMSEGP